MGEHLEDLVALSRADMTTKRRDKRSRYMFQLKELTDRIAQLAAEDAKVPPLPKGLGEEITRAFGIPPSRRIGAIRRMLEEDVSAGIIPGEQPSAFYIAHIGAHRARFGVDQAG